MHTANSSLHKPKRIKRERRRGWRKPVGAVTITRPGRYGNPYRVTRKRDGWHVVVISQPHQDDLDLGRFDTKLEATKYSIKRFRKLVRSAEWKEKVRELRGKDLCCWCDLDMPCHGDVLIELANQ